MATKKAEPKTDRIGPFYTHSEALEALDPLSGAEVVRDRLWWIETPVVQEEPTKGKADE